ncbi:MAG: RNA methyltransferase [Verrucomicrobia bacterium]|nr:RNA methyltransferase [Verrucomicrobiota bacterium]
MIHLRKIDNFNHPALEPYLTLRRPQKHRRAGLLVAPSARVVIRLLQSRFTIVSLLITHSWLDKLDPLLRRRDEEIEVFIGTKELLEQLIGYSMHQGVMAVARVPEPERLEALLAQSTHPQLFVGIDEIANAENLGAIIRSCVAFGVQCVIIGETSCSPYLRRAVGSSTGAIFQIPIIESDDLAWDLGVMRRADIRIIGAHPGAGQVELFETNLACDCCLVFGSEGHGIRPCILDICNETAAVPMPPEIDSLNVAGAAAVFLYETFRQRYQLPKE